jgi:hypothetical protein
MKRTFQEQPRGMATTTRHETSLWADGSLPFPSLKALLIAAFDLKPGIEYVDADTADVRERSSVVRHTGGVMIQSRASLSGGLLFHETCIPIYYFLSSFGMVCRTWRLALDELLQDKNFALLVRREQVPHSITWLLQKRPSPFMPKQFRKIPAMWLTRTPYT